MSPPGDREHDDDLAPEVQDDAEIETEEYPGALGDDEAPESGGTQDDDHDHDDSI